MSKKSVCKRQKVWGVLHARNATNDKSMAEKEYNVSDEEMQGCIHEIRDILYGDGETPDFYAELKEAAWNILHENPDTDLENWKMMLIEQYPTEVVDALGTNPPEVFAELSDWWDSMGYDDGITDLCYTFRDWAEYFATERSVELYDLLVEAKREIKRLEGVISSKQ